MDRMKTFFNYALVIILFYIFSEIMINVNLESVYQDIGRRDKIEQVSIYQAEATKVNGRIKGKIYNDAKNKITNKYIRIDLYSERDNLLGSKYIDVSNMRADETRDLEVYFKVQDVEYYEVKFVDEKVEGELPEMYKDLTWGEIRIGVIITYLLLPKGVSLFGLLF